MKFFPPLELGWLNGWILLVAFYAVFGLLMLLFPREVVARLYDRTGWSEKIRKVSMAAKLAAIIVFLLIFLTPLNAMTRAFIPGIILYVLGFVLMVISLINYRNTPLNEPVVQGAYRFSRNPQWAALVAIMLGITLTIGSWIATILVASLTILGHLRIVAEEKACLDQYGESFQEYMQKAPRYLLFF